MGTCKAFTRKGTRCIMEIDAGLVFCHIHNPEGKFQRSQRVQLSTGAKRPMIQKASPTRSLVIKNVMCVYCSAPVGTQCVRRNGNPRTSQHQERWNTYIQSVEMVH